MPYAWNAVAIAPLVALVASTALAVLVLRTDAHRAVNRRLALVLALEALYAGFQAASVVFAWDAEALPVIWTLSGTGVLALAGAYLYFVALLNTPLAVPLRSKALQAGLVVMVVGWTMASLALGGPVGGDTVGIAVLLLASLIGIAVTVSAYRRSPQGTQMHAQAGALAAAFVARDIIWIASVVGAVVVSASPIPDAVADMLWTVGPAAAVLTYVPLLAYGILRTQLFDIDLKIKVGIRRSTVATVMLVCVLAAAKMAEFYLSRRYGLIAGGIAAGMMLVLAPRLNRLGDKMATTALPKVESTTKYVEFRKMEVYRAAIESALEGGEPNAKERDMLDRLRAKLGIPAADADALEGDVRATLGLPKGPSSASPTKGTAV
ncbi:MAG: hypothetical protein QOC71_1567 [Thermoplasmata archaeon]|nr:hypothetical protein [Thermoplasmata archaeon]